MLRVFEAFAGYGSQSIALRNLGIEHEVVAISEIDKYAIKAYEAIHGPTLNLGDICKIDPKDIPQHDLFTYSFPCQDISVAGKTKGIVKGETRSGLLYECEKIIEYCKPKYLLLENVKNLVGKKFKADFDKWLEYLESLGYTNYWQVLNAKDYGVPQNRERVFVVSILGGHEAYKFANKIPLDKCIGDILENEVDKKYYIDNKRAEKLMETYSDDFLKKNKDEIQQITHPKFSQQRVYSTNGISPTIAAGNNGGGKEPCKIVEINHKPYEFPKPILLDKCIADILEDEVDEKYYLSEKIQNRFTPFPADRLNNDSIEVLGTTAPNPYNKKGNLIYDKCTSAWVYNPNKCISTLSARDYKQPKQIVGDRIRKLTPRECFRLMGMREDDIDKIQAAGISNTQQYKMAGNSIVINVLEAIFKNLFKGE